MSFTRLDARTIVVNETPQLPVFADRPEPPRQEDRMLDRAALRKKFNADAAELEEIIGLPGFPSASRTSSGSPPTSSTARAGIPSYVSSASGSMTAGM